MPRSEAPVDKKETPSLKTIFNKKEEPKKEESTETNETGEEQLTPITPESARRKLDQYIGEKKVSNTVKIILSKPVKVVDSKIQLTISNSVEIAMIQGAEVELLGYLRSELKNSSISFDYQVSEGNEERRPYTAEEKFKAMAKKNPALLKLADEFGLDTDH